MHAHSAVVAAATLLAASAPAASAQVTPVRSSLETTSQIGLSVVDLVDADMQSEDQGATTGALGPLVSPVLITSVDGVYTGSTTASATFSDASSGTFVASQTYDGDQFGDEPTAQSFSTTLIGRFEYDFTVSGESSVRFQGDLSNSGPSFIGFTVRISVFSESVVGGGFTGAFFDQTLTDDTMPGSTGFNVVVPLEAESGNYRIRIRLVHSGNSGLETDVEVGSTTVDWTIETPASCPADINGNGVADPGDFTSWIAAYNTGDLAADQNGSGSLDPGDFTAWVANYNAGC